MKAKYLSDQKIAAVRDAADRLIELRARRAGRDQIRQAERDLEAALEATR